MSLERRQPPTPDELAAILRDDARFEPPAQVLARARELGRQVAARRARDAATIRAGALGEFLDLAGATVLAWFRRPIGGGDLADGIIGLRDDRGTDLVSVTSAENGLAIEFERTSGEDGIVQFVGRLASLDGMAVRADVLALDATGRIVAREESDAAGLFLIRSSVATARLAVLCRRADGSALPPVVLELAAESN